MYCGMSINGTSVKSREAPFAVSSIRIKDLMCLYTKEVCALVDVIDELVSDQRCLDVQHRQNTNCG
jgi:hypothetical protein